MPPTSVTTPAAWMKSGVQPGSVNGATRTLLDVLRDQLALTGPKKSCDLRECGACWVALLDQQSRLARHRLACSLGVARSSSRGERVSKDQITHDVRNRDTIGHGRATSRTL